METDLINNVVLQYVLIGILTIVTGLLCHYYISIANKDNGKFDKKEFDRLVLYVMMFVFVGLVVLKYEVEVYLLMLFTYWLGKDKIGEININRKKPEQ